MIGSEVELGIGVRRLRILISRYVYHTRLDADNFDDGEKEKIARSLIPHEQMLLASQYGKYFELVPSPTSTGRMEDTSITIPIPIANHFSPQVGTPNTTHNHGHEEKETKAGG